MIRARLVTLDGQYDVKFDATPWARTALLEDIGDLAAGGFAYSAARRPRGPAEDVSHLNGYKPLMDAFCAVIGGTPADDESDRYRVTVDEGDLLRFLRSHRSLAYAALRKLEMVAPAPESPAAEFDPDGYAVRHFGDVGLDEEVTAALAERLEADDDGGAATLASLAAELGNRDETAGRIGRLATLLGGDVRIADLLGDRRPVPAPR